MADDVKIEFKEADNVKKSLLSIFCWWNCFKTCLLRVIVISENILKINSPKSTLNWKLHVGSVFTPS